MHVYVLIAIIIYTDCHLGSQYIALKYIATYTHTHTLDKHMHVAMMVCTDRMDTYCIAGNFRWFKISRNCLLAL